MRKIDRTNEENINFQGYRMKIIEYKDANNLVIEFQDNYKYQEKNKYERFKKGNIPNPYHPTIYGIGYLGISSCSDGNNNHKLSNVVWKDMLCRCYNKEWRNKHPYYEKCHVCDEWLNYSVFEKWFNDNYYQVGNEQMNLDKDVLVKNNSFYSPKTCCFVPHRINAILVKSIRKTNKDKNRILPIGITNKNNVYYTKLFDYKNKVLKRPNLSSLDIDYLFNMYKNSKEYYIKQVANEYKDYIPNNVYNALYNYKIERE